MAGQHVGLGGGQHRRRVQDHVPVGVARSDFLNEVAHLFAVKQFGGVRGHLAGLQQREFIEIRLDQQLRKVQIVLQVLRQTGLGRQAEEVVQVGPPEVAVYDEHVFAYHLRDGHGEVRRNGGFALARQCAGNEDGAHLLAVGRLHVQAQFANLLGCDASVADILEIASVVQDAAFEVRLDGAFGSEEQVLRGVKPGDVERRDCGKDRPVDDPAQIDRTFDGVVGHLHQQCQGAAHNQSADGRDDHDKGKPGRTVHQRQRGLEPLDVPGFAARTEAHAPLEEFLLSLGTLVPLERLLVPGRQFFLLFVHAFQSGLNCERAADSIVQVFLFRLQFLDALRVPPHGNLERSKAYHRVEPLRVGIGMHPGADKFFQDFPYLGVLQFLAHQVRRSRFFTFSLGRSVFRFSRHERNLGVHVTGKPRQHLEFFQFFLNLPRFLLQYAYLAPEFRQMRLGNLPEFILEFRELCFGQPAAGVLRSRGVFLNPFLDFLLSFLFFPPRSLLAAHLFIQSPALSAQRRQFYRYLLYLLVLNDGLALQLSEHGSLFLDLPISGPICLGNPVDVLLVVVVKFAREYLRRVAPRFERPGAGRQEAPEPSYLYRQYRVCGAVTGYLFTQGAYVRSHVLQPPSHVVETLGHSVRRLRFHHLCLDMLAYPFGAVEPLLGFPVLRQVPALLVLKYLSAFLLPFEHPLGHLVAHRPGDETVVGRVFNLDDWLILAELYQEVLPCGLVLLADGGLRTGVQPEQKCLHPAQQALRT